MKATVTCKCGHTITIDVYGKSADRERKIKSTEERLCPECYRIVMAEEAAKSASEDNLPPLSGTDRQVVWAMRVRADRVREAKSQAAATKARNAMILALHPDIAEDVAKADARADESLAQILAWIRTETEARFWLETKDNNDFFGEHSPAWDHGKH